MKSITFISPYYLRVEDRITNDNGAYLFESAGSGGLKQLNCDWYPVDSARAFAKKCDIPLSCIVATMGFDDRIGLGLATARANAEKLRARRARRYAAQSEQDFT